MKWTTRLGTWLVDGCFAGITLIALAACVSLLLVLFVPLVLISALWILALIGAMTLGSYLKSTLHPELREQHWTGTMQRLQNKYLNWKAERLDAEEQDRRYNGNWRHTEGEQHDRYTDSELQEEEIHLAEGDTRTSELAASVLDGGGSKLEDRDYC